MTRTVLVVAAHADDEALGCGGTMARHAAAGDEVHVLFLADGVGARGDSASQDTAMGERRAAARRAAAILGAQPPTFLDFPDNRLDTLPLLEITRAVESVAGKLDPEIVYTHHAGDLNVDHRICNQAVLTAFRAFPGQSVRAIHGFEVCSSTEWAFGSTGPAFVPTRYVDISPFVETKLAALDAYAMEMRPFPHVRSPRAVGALAAWRGACVGCEAAEAFTTIREII
jgi:LmbE family N-acetylglucosaminyl deacetylase